MAEAEVLKLQKHLALLQEEYVNLQNKYEELNRKYEISSALAQDGRDHFVTRLLSAVASLYDSQRYSDLQVNVSGQRIRAHKFILNARSDTWGVPDLNAVDELTVDAGIPYEVGAAMLRWVYTDCIDVKADSDFLLLLLKCAGRFKLSSLVRRCEQALTSHVTVKNCIKFYQTAYEISAEALMNHCSELMSSHWDDFTSEDFACMPAPLLYQMLKSKSRFPLHRAIKAHREDVVFLFIIEFSSLLQTKLNEKDDHGVLPLQLALAQKQESIAETLVKNHADLNVQDLMGANMLHRAIQTGDNFSAMFLVKHDIQPNHSTYEHSQTALHLIPQSPLVDSHKVELTSILLNKGANANIQDSKGNTPLQQAIIHKCLPVFNTLLMFASLDLELQNAEGYSALWLAVLNPEAELADGCMAAKLIKKGSQRDSIHLRSGNSLLHTVTSMKKEDSAIFLVEQGANYGVVNKLGETALHLAAQHGLLRLVKKLLSSGANPNAQTFPPFITKHGTQSVSSRTQSVSSPQPAPPADESNPWEMDRSNGNTRYNPFEEEGSRSPEETSPVVNGTSSENEVGTDNSADSLAFHSEPVGLQTPVHVAIEFHHDEVVEAFLQYREEAMKSKPVGSQIVPDFSLKDSNDQSALAVALWAGMHELARKFIISGTSINDSNARGLTLLHQAILRADTPSCLFLMDNRADLSCRTLKNETAMELAINKHLSAVVAALCSHHAPVNQISSRGHPVIWQALEADDHAVCDVLVKFRCDLNWWHSGPGCCLQTLLHKAIDENKQRHACYLIKNGGDVDSPRRTGLAGEGGEEARDGQTPLHLASAWGQEEVVQKLIENNAKINAQDRDGRSALHIAISNQQSTIIYLLLSHPELDVMIRDKNGWTPFASAMTIKDNKAAQAILDRAPTAADQFDNRGRNFLHVAIQKTDIESVLFLISVHADVNSRMRDANQLTPLHLAVKSGSEIIVRNLLLAGARINDLTLNRQTALHIAAALDHATIMTILIENGVDYTALDNDRNNALHIAVQQSNLSACRILLTETRIDAEAVNLRGQNPLHILGQHGRENAAAIFDLFIEAMPEYPINKPDVEGNTVLLLAYMNGNGNLCRAAVRAGACLGQTNLQAVNIFNAPVATKALLLKLLDMLSVEPPWTEGELCLECGTRFNIKTRKHHCRHCGRLLCAKCSDREMPVIKFSLNKPVRVCEVCFDVLTLGSS